MPLCELTTVYVQIVEETIPELVKLKKEGLIRHIGITGLPLPIYRKVLDRCLPLSVHLCRFCLQCFVSLLITNMNNPLPPTHPCPLPSLTPTSGGKQCCCQALDRRLPKLEIMGPCCAARRLPNGTVDVILAYCHNSINDDSLQDLVPYLQEQGVGIISASPMSMGLLTTKVGLLFALKQLPALRRQQHCCQTMLSFSLRKFA